MAFDTPKAIFYTTIVNFQLSIVNYLLSIVNYFTAGLGFAFGEVSTS